MSELQQKPLSLKNPKTVTQSMKSVQLMEYKQSMVWKIRRKHNWITAIQFFKVCTAVSNVTDVH